MYDYYNDLLNPLNPLNPASPYYQGNFNHSQSENELPDEINGEYTIKVIIFAIMKVRKLKNN